VWWGGREDIVAQAACVVSLVGSETVTIIGYETMTGKKLEAVREETSVLVREEALNERGWVR
jgi:hypothetical protein